MPQELIITTALNGWVIQAGCQTIVFNDRATFLVEFSKWLEDPIGTEKKYCEEMKKRGLVPAQDVAARLPPPASVGQESAGPAPEV